MLEYIDFLIRISISFRAYISGGSHFWMSHFTLIPLNTLTQPHVRGHHHRIILTDSKMWNILKGRSSTVRSDQNRPTDRPWSEGGAEWNAVAFALLPTLHRRRRLCGLSRLASYEFSFWSLSVVCHPGTRADGSDRNCEAPQSYLVKLVCGDPFVRSGIAAAASHNSILTGVTVLLEWGGGLCPVFPLSTPVSRFPGWNNNPGVFFSRYFILTGKLKGYRNRWNGGSS